MQTKHEIQELLSSAGVSPNRRLGQHFLVDLNLMRLLVEAAQLGRGDVVLEVGCGTGSLTQALVEQAGAVVAVEIDRTLAPIAESQVAGWENVQIMHADILSGKGTLNPEVVEALEQARTRLQSTGPTERGREVSLGRLLLVSNLPYDVASPVMIHLAKGPLVADAMFVTVQKEVAERMTAGPGGRDYGTLSIFLQATGEVELTRRLKPSVFWPPPAVDSAIVRYARDEGKCRRILDMGLFGSVVSLFIGHRRKMLRACIKEAPPELGDRACRGLPARDSRAGRPRHEGDRDVWLKIFEQHAIDPTRRPEELSPQQYVDLANSCCHLIDTR